MDVGSVALPTSVSTSPTIMAYAEDDGDITYCLWMSNISGSVGNSCSELSTGDLTEGMHWITFSAMDDAAQWSDTDSIEVPFVKDTFTIDVNTGTVELNCTSRLYFQILTNNLRPQLEAGGC